MIFGTVGTHDARMDRLVRTLDGWAAEHSEERVVIQAGAAADDVRNAPAVAFTSDEQIRSWLEEATVVVTHGGPSVLLRLIDQGKRPIVMPRERRYGEHVDDHQVDFAKFLAARHLIVLVRSPAQLRKALSHPTPVEGDATPLPPLDLAAAVARFDQHVRDLF